MIIMLRKKGKAEAFILDGMGPLLVEKLQKIIRIRKLIGVVVESLHRLG